MKFWVCSILLTIVGLGGGTPATAEEVPHLEFVRGLRAQGLPDLALEYLQNLKQQKNLSPEVARELPLEIAKTGIDMAQLEPDAGRREALYAQARVGFAAFLKGSTNSPEAAEATFELARIVTLEGKSRLNQANRQEAKPARKIDLAKARTLFEEAGKSLVDAAARISEQLAKTDLPENQKTSLSRARIQVELDTGLNLLDQAMASDEEDVLKRGETIKKAIAVLQKVAAADEKNPLYWQARAWLGRCYYEIDSPKDARTELVKVTQAVGPAAEPGKRLARYFYLLVLDKDPSVKDPLPAKVRAAEEWLQTYREYQNTPEGLGVRFQLAEAFLGQALKKPKSMQNSPEVRQLYGRAEKLFAALEQGDNEYSEQARNRKLNIIITLSEQSARGDISKLRNFEECYLRAQVEIGSMMQEEKDLARDAAPNLVKKHEEKRKKHFENIITALSRALDLIDAKAPKADIMEANYLLTYAYLSAGEPYRAAILGENLARTEPKSHRASTAAAYALEAYGQLLGQDERNEIGADALDADRSRLRNLALYMETNWPGDPNTDLARDQLGLIALQQKKYADAMAFLGRVSPAYSRYTLTQFQFANAALLADKDGIKPLTGQPSFQEQAIGALKKIPDLAGGSDQATTQFYFYARLELAQLLFGARQYVQMEAITTELLKHWGVNVNLNETVKTEIEPTIKVLPLYAIYGRADTEFRANHFPEVLKLLEPVAEQAKQNQLATKDPTLVRGILGVLLRSYIRVGKMKQAQETLDLLLQKSSGDLQGATAILGELIQQLKEQIDELRKKGAPAEAELAKTVASFTTFLDGLANQPPDKLGPDLVRFIAFGYASLENHKQAAALLERIPEPKAPADAAKEGFYHAVRLMYARELRLDKQFEPARQELKKILKTPWGERTLEAKKENVFLMEDEEKYAAAARAWNGMMTGLRPQIDKDAKLKEQYFECYYHLVYSLYKNASKMTNDDRKKENVRRAANLYIKLKSSKPDMGSDLLKKKYQDLLQKEEPLKLQIDELEKSSQ